VVLDSDGSAGWWPSVAIDSHDPPPVSYRAADADELRYVHPDSWQSGSCAPVAKPGGDGGECDRLARELY